MEHKLYYFGYGMNTHAGQMANRCPDSRYIGVATLPAHRFRFAVHADIVENAHSQVDGVLWQITPTCLQNLDALEGYPDYYGRKMVRVECMGLSYWCWVYQMQEGLPDAPPSKQYLTLVTEGYTQHGVDSRQITSALKHFVTE